MTRRWSFEGEPTAAQLDEIAEVLLAGGVVLLPTDTIYGLHALAADEAAVARIAELKGRDDQKPFVVLGASLAALEAIGIDAALPEVRTALEALWPAPLTAILPLGRPVAASRGTASLAVRVPDLAWLRSLLQRTGPLASTSANRAGEPPIESPETLARTLLDGLTGLADAGLLSGEPSAIVDFTGPEPRVLREGRHLFTQKVWKTLRKSL
jgi:tRNA threonylcarbamoyl adenosine modification protein (Sua5/YciO/YrdC/YwlC family)